MPIVSGLLGASGASRAGNAVNNTAIAAEHGILNAGQSAQQGVQQQIIQNAGDVNNAAAGASAGVNTAAGAANNTLGNTLSGVQSNLKPYLQGGAQGTNALAAYAASNPTFSFNPSDLQNDPGYQFQLQQGTEAVNQNAAASGLGNSGNTMKALQQYGQGLAGTYYNDAFNRAQQTFQTNQNTTLANNSALMNSGLAASGLNNQAALGIGSQQANNTLGAGYYGGNALQSAAALNAGQGLQGQEYIGNAGLQSSQQAGNFALTGAGANAQGILNSTNSLANMFSGIAGAIPGYGMIGNLFGLNTSGH